MNQEKRRLILNGLLSVPIFGKARLGSYKELLKLRNNKFRFHISEDILIFDDLLIH